MEHGAWGMGRGARSMGHGALSTGHGAWNKEQGAGGMANNQAYFRFYEELNDFLPQELRKITFAWDFTGNPSVKDAIEAMNVPHAEIDLVVINGVSVDFSDRLTRVAIFQNL